MDGAMIGKSQAYSSSGPSPGLREELFNIKKADALLNRERMRWVEGVEKWLQLQETLQHRTEPRSPHDPRSPRVVDLDLTPKEEIRVLVAAESASNTCIPTPSPRSGSNYLGGAASGGEGIVKPPRETTGDSAKPWPAKPVIAKPARETTGDSAADDDVELMEGPLLPTEEQSGGRKNGSSAGHRAAAQRAAAMARATVVNEELDPGTASGTASGTAPGNFHQHLDKPKTARLVSVMSDEGTWSTQSKDHKHQDLDISDDQAWIADRFDPLTSRKKARQTAIMVEQARQGSFRLGSVVGGGDDEDVLRRRAEQTAMLPHGEKVRVSEVVRFEAQRWFVSSFLRHPFTELTIALLILGNSVLVGLEVQWTVENPVRAKEGVPTVFTIFGMSFNCVFAVEVVLRMFANGIRFFTGAQKGWNIFDSFLVISSVIEIVLEIVTKAGQSDVSSLRVVRIVRITRILRVVRVARIVRMMVALRLLFVQIIGTLRQVFWALCLLILILYAFGMVFAQITSEYISDNINDFQQDQLASSNAVIETDMVRLRKYWADVPRCMYTLYKCVTGGVDWENVASPLAAISWFWVMIFNVFLAFTLFAVMNVVVGVFCQSAIQTAALDHETQVREKMREKNGFINQINALFHDIDESGDGDITYHELEAHLDDVRVCAYFESLGLDPSDAWDLFKLIDADSSATINCEEFVIGCLRLRGPAKAIDVEKMMYENRTTRKRLASFMKFTELALNRILPPEAAQTIGAQVRHSQVDKTEKARQ